MVKRNVEWHKVKIWAFAARTQSTLNARVSSFACIRSEFFFFLGEQKLKIKWMREVKRSSGDLWPLASRKSIIHFRKFIYLTKYIGYGFRVRSSIYEFQSLSSHIHTSHSGSIHNIVLSTRHSRRNVSILFFSFTVNKRWTKIVRFRNRKTQKKYYRKKKSKNKKQYKEFTIIIIRECEDEKHWTLNIHFSHTFFSRCCRYFGYLVKNVK